ncbi:hypothetical protein MRX96_015686 [Rhipicephalus microplus]
MSPGMYTTPKPSEASTPSVATTEESEEEFPTECDVNGVIYKEGDQVPDGNPCHFCNCLEGEVICAERICRPPGPECKPLPKSPDQCCPDYDCEGVTTPAAVSTVEGRKKPPEVTPAMAETTPAVTAPSTPQPGEYGDDVAKPCNVQGTTVEHGQVIQTANPCTFCKCTFGEMVCAERICEEPPRPGCKPTGVKPEQCCAEAFICPSEEEEGREEMVTHRPSVFKFTTISPTIADFTKIFGPNVTTTPVPSTTVTPFVIEVMTEPPASQPPVHDLSTGEPEATTTAKTETGVTDGNGTSPTTETPPEGANATTATFPTKPLVHYTTTTEASTAVTSAEPEEPREDEATTPGGSVVEPVEGKKATPAPESTESPSLFTTIMDFFTGSTTEAPEVNVTTPSVPSATVTTPKPVAETEKPAETAATAGAPVKEPTKTKSTATPEVKTPPPGVTATGEPELPREEGTTLTASTEEPESTTTEGAIIIEEGSCIFDAKVYQSAEQIPRPDPCDFCFCFRGDIICLQQTCPPPIPQCYETPISGFCCPRYECPVHMTVKNVSLSTTTTTTTTTTTPAPRFMQQQLEATMEVKGCEVNGSFYQVGQVVKKASGPCLECICDASGMIKCNPKDCQPQAPLLLRMNRSYFRTR